jgi:hypothetical protein
LAVPKCCLFTLEFRASGELEEVNTIELLFTIYLSIAAKEPKMSGGYISLYNGSSVFSDAELANALPDFQSQVSNEFNWYWGLNAYLDINGGGSPITIVDYPGANDPPNALGYHYIDGNYQQYAVIFAGLAQDNGYSVTGVISHELLEMMADQLVDTVNLYDYGDGTGIIVIQEVCDPCEMSLYYEGPNGNIVSDFALPAWWVPGDPNPVDFLNVIPGPLQLASGGYISYQNVTLSGWQQAFGDKAKQDFDKAAEVIRKGVASIGNPRMDVIRQIQRKGEHGDAQQRRPVPSGAKQGRHEISLERRIQSARQAEKITVVKRQDVPKVGVPQPGQQTQQTLAAAAGVMAGYGMGPKAQSLPNKS